MQFHARASMSARLALPGAGASRVAARATVSRRTRARGRVRRVTCTSAQILTWKKKNSYVYEDPGVDGRFLLLEILEEGHGAANGAWGGHPGPNSGRVALLAGSKFGWV